MSDLPEVKPERLCGPDCQVPDWPHAEVQVAWIGNSPVLHCDSERPVPGTGGWNGYYTEIPDTYCLCGHPDYSLCPAPGARWWESPIERSDDYPGPSREDQR